MKRVSGSLLNLKEAGSSDQQSTRRQIHTGQKDLDSHHWRKTKAHWHALI